MLPQGGTRFDRKNNHRWGTTPLNMRMEWYDYINSPSYLGREALNGSLCFVTGCDKTKAWGSAAMSKPSDIREFSIKFLVGGLSEGRIALRSSWTTQEWTDTRIYPDQDIDMGGSPPVRENQGVFIRGFTISVREKSWKTKIWPGLGQRVAQLAGVSGKSGNLQLLDQERHTRSKTWFASSISPSMGRQRGYDSWVYCRKRTSANDSINHAC